MGTGHSMDDDLGHGAAQAAVDRVLLDRDDPAGLVRRGQRWPRGRGG